MPSDFPSIEMGTQRVPIVYFSSGALTIAQNLVTYVARVDSGTSAGIMRRNLNTSLAFSIASMERPTLQRFRARESPSYYSINWIELMLPGRSLLLCAGGSGPGMGRIRDGTNILFSALVAWAGDRPSPDPVKQTSPH